jgi:Tol biopolymer transport system component
LPEDDAKRKASVFQHAEEIYVMNANGSGLTRLTNNMAVDGAPAFSPDGSKIAFTSDRDGNYEIYVMNADGSR